MRAISPQTPPPPSPPPGIPDLFVCGTMHETWWSANNRKNRFFVVGADFVISKLHLQHTDTKELFCSARERVNDYGWKEQIRGFEWFCSHTQIRPEKRYEAKVFDRAALIIVALQIAAERKFLDTPISNGQTSIEKINVFDHTGILPAQYFIDQFDKEMLKQLRQEYPGFDEECLKEIGQYKVGSLLLDEMTDSYCVPKSVADKIIKFIYKKTSGSVAVGPTVNSGEDCTCMHLGKKNAAPSLIVSLTKSRTAIIDNDH